LPPKHRHNLSRFKPDPKRAATGGKSVTGRLVCHRDGYGFVIPDQPLPQVQGDIFIGAQELASAMHGDRVQVGGVRIDRQGKASGRVEKVLHRAQAAVVGQFRYFPPFGYVIPYEERILQQIEIPPGQRRAAGERLGLPDVSPEELDGAIVNVEVTRFPSPVQNATGRILEVLGRPGDFGVDVEVVIRKHHIPHQFPLEVLEEAAAISQSIREAELRRRKDFRDLPIVTIDGETAKDFDDAVAVETFPNGNFELQVHIADVSHYVCPGGALDREARLRGTSVYFPDRAVPMLPVELSNGICSLNPREERLTLSVLMEIDHRGEMVNAEFCEGIIRSAERMTYTAVNQVLENDPAARERYAALAERFERMRDLALILNKKRRGRGAIDFDLPEPVIEFDELGVMTAITRSERNIAHRIIEEFMLAANEAVAGRLEGLGVASLFRIHEKPDPQKVIEFEEMAASFGYSLGIGPLPVQRFSAGGRGGRKGADRRRPKSIELPAGELDIRPRHYQRLSDKLEGQPEERILSYLMLRSLQQARYSERNEGHFALATPCYTHFTSPIRRYPDLMVHRILRAVLTAAQGTAPPPAIPPPISQEPPRKRGGKRKPPAGSGPAFPDPVAVSELAAVAVESSEAERRAQDAERELLEWKKVRFMRDKVGDEFDALIVSVGKLGFFVELLDLFIEGLVPIETLTDQRYLFREQQRQWVGERNRRVFRIGDRLRVRLDRVGDPLGKMNFSVAE